MMVETTEMMKLETQYNAKMKLYNELLKCMLEDSISAEDMILNTQELNTVNQNKFLMSDEFKLQWCTMSKLDMQIFCRNLMNSSEFPLDFKKEVLESLIWLLINNLNNGYGECLTNLLVVQDMYEAWKYLNGFN